MSAQNVSDKERLLKTLQVHGERFLQAFEHVEGSKRSQKRKLETNRLLLATRKIPKIDTGSGEEWGGIESVYDAVDNDNADEGEISFSEDGSIEGFEQEDDNFTGKSSEHPDNVIVFSDVPPTSSISNYTSKAQMRAFMSSKVAKLGTEHPNAPLQDKSDADKEDERTNAQNDAMLHKLVHTTLLSGSLNTELDLTPAQRRKALAGRVLEISGTAKLATGEKMVRAAERNMAAKHVREGILAKQNERSKQELENAKNLGNYHPMLKKLYDDTSSSKTSRKRDRGLKMGIGKFAGGALRLSQDEIGMVEGPRLDGRGRGGSRGRGHGGSRGRSRGGSRGRGRGQSGKRK